MAFNDFVYRLKDGWDRIVGSFLHGEQEDDYSQPQPFYGQQHNGQSYNQQEGETSYGYSQQPYQGQRSPYAGSYAQQYEQEEPVAYETQEVYVEPMEQPANNMVAFPGVTQEQMAGAHMQATQTQIIQLKDRETCKTVIEALRGNASVLINMETIASDMEKQRCVDMLGGAAYTLNCQISKVSGKGVYFISPANMEVEMDDATQRLNGVVKAPAQGRMANPLYSRQQRPEYQENEYNHGNYQQQPMAVGYESQSEYAAPYGAYEQPQSHYNQQAPRARESYGSGNWSSYGSGR